VGCRPCRPSVASLCARGNTSESSWSACECTALNDSAVRSSAGGVCTKAETSCPDLQARLWYTAQVRVRHKYATLSRAAAASVCDVCQATVPALGRKGLGYMRVTGTSCALARLEMHIQSPANSTTDACGGLSGLRARAASDLKSDKCLRASMNASGSARAVGSSGLHARPRHVYVTCVNVLSCGGQVIIRALSIRRAPRCGRQITGRPRHLAGGCKHAQMSSSALASRKEYFRTRYGVVQERRVLHIIADRFTCLDCVAGVLVVSLRLRCPGCHAT
jgi:hypothetical protein